MGSATFAVSQSHHISLFALQRQRSLDSSLFLND
jgi:hypothetical protein